MFTQTTPRTGIACKIQKAHGQADPKLNIRSTTISYLTRQTQQAAETKLWDLVQHNVNALRLQIEWLGTHSVEHRMFRISSDILPCYTHDDWTEFYFHPDMVSWLERELARVGDRARQLDCRLSFHPGQFCVLASENPEIVERSLQEFEYHADVVRYLGYGKQFQDFKSNVHIGGKLGPSGIKQAVRRLSRVARNILTIENAEFKWGLEHSLELVNTCALVLDIHHHWIYSGGEYIEPTDPRIEQVIESWQGVRPVVHYSLSREDVLLDHCVETKPNLPELKSQGFTNTKLRAHSDYYWNQASNRWAHSHSTWADIMLEAKEKNLARNSFLESVS